jgi:hypothetical protein
MLRLLLVVVSAVLLGVGVCACSSSGQTASRRGSSGPGSSATHYVTVCPVTRPSSSVQVEGIPASLNYGNRSLHTILWPHGTLRAGKLANGGSYATVKADGSIYAKLGWWRSTPGTLTISGQRLDAPAPPLRADVPAGLAEAGFQPSGITFPSIGCWKVEGRLAGASLVFVVRVVKV